MVNKYNLIITEKQAEIIMLALDLYTRLSAGQFSNLNDISFEKDEEGIHRKPSEETLKKLHTEMFPKLDMYNASYGIHSHQLPDKIREAYDIYKVMMYEFNKHKGSMNVYADKVRQASKKPLPRFNKIVDDKIVKAEFCECGHTKEGHRDDFGGNTSCTIVTKTGSCPCTEFRLKK